MEVGKEGWAYPLQNTPLSASLRILLFWSVCFTLIYNTSILEQMVSKAIRERALFLAETLRLVCGTLLSLRSVLARLCSHKWLGAQQLYLPAKQIAGQEWWETFPAVKILHGPAKPSELPNKTRTAAHFLQALILMAPMGTAHPLQGKNGKQETRTPTATRCQKSTEGLGL